MRTWICELRAAMARSTPGVLSVAFAVVVGLGSTAAASAAESEATDRRKPFYCLTQQEIDEQGKALAEVEDKAARAIFQSAMDKQQERLDDVAKGGPGVRLRWAKTLAGCQLNEGPADASEWAWALRELQEAAESGDRQSARLLAELAAMGAGVPQSYRDAYRWFALSDRDRVESERQSLAGRGISIADAESLAAFKFVILTKLKATPLLLLSAREMREGRYPVRKAEFRFQACSPNVDVTMIEPSDADVIGESAKRRIEWMMGTLSSQGLPCEDGEGQPLGWIFPYEVGPR